MLDPGITAQALQEGMRTSPTARRGGGKLGQPALGKDPRLPSCLFPSGLATCRLHKERERDSRAERPWS